MTTSDLPYPLWQMPLLQVVMEMKPNSLIEKIKIAETAVAQRLRELENKPCGERGKDGPTQCGFNSSGLEKRADTV